MTQADLTRSASTADRKPVVRSIAMGTSLFSPTHLIILLLVVLLLFGAKRLPEIGRSLGVGMREFKDSVTGVQEATNLNTPAPSELPPPAAIPPAEAAAPVVVAAEPVAAPVAAPVAVPVVAEPVAAEPAPEAEPVAAEAEQKS
jgi:sec-independent protein translocase protein TatA